MKNIKVSTSSAIFVLVLFCGVLIFIYFDVSILSGTSCCKSFLQQKISDDSPMDFKCTDTCPKNISVPKRRRYINSTSSQKCPAYFRWIHEDLKPWKENGISKDMVEAAGKDAHIRIVVLNGRIYVKKVMRVYQTRDIFTVWGILQLLRLYPGYLPDLDIMFECADKPVVKKIDYLGEKIKKIPPMFHYCGSMSTWDIPFPDWSFWGWPELRINPWEILWNELEQGNKKIRWMNRKPYAYWKGNPKVSPVRGNLLQCNITKDKDWGAHIFYLDWEQEKNNTFKNSDLANQCAHRYKIYVEGVAWSVSEKYILACDSMSLVITPHYHDFYSRSLIPTVHYWPINEKDKCRSIKFAVNWGNKHPKKAQKIGQTGSKFILEELKMEHVYDYMFHLLYSYGKLLKYQPTVPEGSIEVCLETLACTGGKLKKKFKLNSMVKNVSNTMPCTMPPPYSPRSLENFMKTQEKLKEEVARDWKKVIK